VRALLVLLAACGSKPPASTTPDNDLDIGRQVGQSRAEPDPVEAPPVAITFDPAKLTPAQIDELDEAQVRAAITKLSDAAPAARLALRGARLAHHRGDDAVARSFVALAATAADRGAMKAELDAIAKVIAAPHVDPKTIAVLLPLSGRFSSIGTELKAAIQLAPPEGTTWLFLDTKGEPDAAAAAVETAFAKGAVAILGPVGEREAIAAARAASLRQLPIALLAPSDGADPSAGVFRVVDSPADEGRAVARIAAEDSFPTVAVFAPRDDVGQEAADAFVAEAKKLGLSVTAQGTYDPTGGNLEPDVKAFLNLVPAQNPRFAEHVRRVGAKKAFTTFSPDVPYSLLFIPDRYDRAAIVAAFLPYFGVELRTQEFMDPTKLQKKHAGSIPQVVQLIGGAGWNHPSLPIRGGAAMQGALFVDAYAGMLGADTGAQFAQSFQQRTKRTPTAAAAQAHDAAWLVATVRKQTANSPEVRGAFRAALARAKLDDGACGPAAMGVDGELQRAPAVLEVSGDQLIVAP
jgi:ABC-type branched-subunit amino acid transport system substrate-binding protein